MAAIFLWKRPTVSDAAGTPRMGVHCDAAATSPLCDAVGGIVRTIRKPATISGAGRLPPADVPGAIDPAVEQNNIDVTICRPGYSRARRPSYAVTGPLKQRMMATQHPGQPLSAHELDHLIPISLGGAPLDPRNLWLQPRDGQANAGDKNVLAYVLWRLVCERRVTLATAQSAIRRNWITAYDTYATPANVKRFHFRHGGDDRRGR